MTCWKVGRGDGASYRHETVSQITGNTELIKEKDMSRDSWDSGEGSWIIQPLSLLVSKAQISASGLVGATAELSLEVSVLQETHTTAVLLQAEELPGGWYIPACTLLPPAFLRQSLDQPVMLISGL